MQRVGILTLYHKTWNYGAQLQAYALQRVIESMGYDCEQISFAWSDVKTEIGYESSSIDKERFLDFSMRIPHSERIYTPETIEECVEKYDIFVCGSDQIWGVNKSMPAYVLPLISLAFVPDDKRKVAYAASMGGKKVSSAVERILKPSVSRLDVISVREKSAVPFTEKMSSKAVQAVLDPTMLLDRDAWSGLAAACLEEQPYIFLYNIGGGEHLNHMADLLAKKMNCKIIKAGYVNADRFGPREFVSLVKNAAFVVTDSFHGTVFSILFQKQFWVSGTDISQADDSKNCRILDLLDILGLEERFFFSDDNTDMLLYKLPIDYSQTEGTLLRLRKGSIDFLQEALSCHEKKDEGNLPLCHCEKTQRKNLCEKPEAPLCTEALVCRGVVSEFLWVKHLDFLKHRREDREGEVLHEDDYFLGVCSSFLEEKCYHCPFGLGIKKPVQFYYLQNLLEDSTIEKLYYENRLVEEYIAKESLHRKFWIEVKRNQLLSKLFIFGNDDLKADRITDIRKHAAIYGAGKLGRVLSDCFASALDCMIDQSEQIHSCAGYEVFQPDSRELKARMKDGSNWTVIVTPVWDYQSIYESLMRKFPKLHVISLEKLVEYFPKGRNDL